MEEQNVQNVQEEQNEQEEQEEQEEPTEFKEVTTAELETSITRLCADLNAATYRQLSMIAEFDLRRGWGDGATRSCAHWLNWHCGISMGAAREKVRTAHALKKLPETSKAFASGELSYSKARAITRVGTIHNEDCLLSYARYGSASHLDKVVKLYRKQYDSAGQLMCDYHSPMFAIDPDTDLTQLSDEERFAAENEGAMHNHDYRQLSSYWDEHGCLIIKARLTAEQGAVVIKAMDVAKEELKAAEPSVDSACMNNDVDSEQTQNTKFSHDQQNREKGCQEEDCQERTAKKRTAERSTANEMMANKKTTSKKKSEKTKQRSSGSRVSLQPDAVPIHW